uniref:Uncharacterized protein n=1 Tax=Hyaloperonospora arabidopsidis (strain Emoy2) TaxID=559515 RepID=M4C5B3_HYAAE
MRTTCRRRMGPMALSWRYVSRLSYLTLVVICGLLRVHASGASRSRYCQKSYSRDVEVVPRWLGRRR